MEAFRIIREYVKKEYCISFGDFLRNPLSNDIDWCSPSEPNEGLVVYHISRFEGEKLINLAQMLQGKRHGLQVTIRVKGQMENANIVEF